MNYATLNGNDGSSREFCFLAGVGCTRNHADNWIAHQDDFNSLLESLNAGANSSNIEVAPVQKLEEKSKKAKSRVQCVDPY